MGQPHDYGRSAPHDHRAFAAANDLNRQSSPGRPLYHDMNASRNIGKSMPLLYIYIYIIFYIHSFIFSTDPRNGTPQRPSNLGLDSSPRKPLVETKTDYGKYRYACSNVLYSIHRELSLIVCEIIYAIFTFSFSDVDAIFWNESHAISNVS